MQLINREFYNLYRERRRSVAREIDQYKLFVKAVNGLLLTMRDIIEQSEGGLYIQGLGYFCHEKSKKKIKGRGNTPFLKRVKKEYKYHLTFFPDKKLEGWYVKYNVDNFKKSKKEKYYIHFDLIESYYEARKFSTSLKNTGAIAKYAT